MFDKVAPAVADAPAAGDPAVTTDSDQKAEEADRKPPSKLADALTAVAREAAARKLLPPLHGAEAE